MDSNSERLMEDIAVPRKLEPHWNEGMMVASIAISLLGAFTSTQLWVLFP